MGLLRTAAIIAVGVALLPSDREQQEQLYKRAASAATWAVTFCDRNGPTCEQGEKLWAQFVAKAEFGAKLAYDMIRSSQEAETKIGAKEDADTEAPARIAPASVRPLDGTLTPQDLKPVWRGKPGAKGSI